MNAAQDQVLEHALGEIFEEGSTDLSERVLRRLQELDERGADVAQRARRPWFAIAGAVALAACVLLLFQLVRPDAPPATDALASSSQPLAVVYAGSFEPRLRETFDAGSTLVNGPEGEREILLASGETLRMGPCSMLTLARDERGLVLEPRLGSLHMSAPNPSSVRIRSSLGTLSLVSSGRLRVELPAEGYDLEHSELFRQLAEEIHMKTALPLILTVVTVFEGQALLETPLGSRTLEAGVTLQDEDPQLRAERIREKLLEEVGTWDLSVVHLSPDGERSDPLEGVEVCRAGPGDQWLLTETKISQGERVTEFHTAIGFHRLKGAYVGTLIDSFGGEPGLLKGTPTADLSTRTVQMYSAHGTSGFDLRAVMTWESENRRRTEFQVLHDGEWVLMREMLHSRRE